MSDEDLVTDKWDGPRLIKETINSMNQNIRLTKTTLMNKYIFGGIYFYTNLDLHTTRKL